MVSMTKSPVDPAAKKMVGTLSLLSVSQRVIQPSSRMRKRTNVATLSKATLRYISLCLDMPYT